MSAAAVATSASATPGATALRLPLPFTAIPTNASMTPSTVPRSPMSGLTEPIVASDGMKCARRSRWSIVSESSTRRSASTCDAGERRELPRGVAPPELGDEVRGARTMRA